MNVNHLKDEISLQVDMYNGECEAQQLPQRLDLLIIEEPKVEEYVDEGFSEPMHMFLNRFGKPPYYIYLDPESEATYLVSNVPLNDSFLDARANCGDPVVLGKNTSKSNLGYTFCYIVEFEKPFIEFEGEPEPSITLHPWYAFSKQAYEREALNFLFGIDRRSNAKLVWQSETVLEVHAK